MTIQSYEIRALDDFGGRIHWVPSDIGAWCPADSVRRLEADMTALRAELASLKAPPKVLSAEEVTEAGVYWWRNSETGVWICRNINRFMLLDCTAMRGQFIGPLKMPEV